MNKKRSGPVPALLHNFGESYAVMQEPAPITFAKKLSYNHLWAKLKSRPCRAQMYVWRRPSPPVAPSRV